MAQSTPVGINITALNALVRAKPALPVFEHVGFGVVRAVDLRLDRFDFALVAGAALARHCHANRSRVGAEREHPRRP